MPSLQFSSLLFTPRITSGNMADSAEKSSKRPHVDVDQSAPHHIYIGPLVGRDAPLFEGEAVFNQVEAKKNKVEEKRIVKLFDYRAKQYVILLFYPLDLTGVCPSELNAFNRNYAQFQKYKTQVIAVSTEPVFSHLHWLQKEKGGIGEMKFPIISDVTKQISRAYHVLDPEGVVIRGLFIIDLAGKIQHATINSVNIGRSVEETLRVLRAVKFLGENSLKACAEGWSPNDPEAKTLEVKKNYPEEYAKARIYKGTLTSTL